MHEFEIIDAADSRVPLVIYVPKPLGRRPWDPPAAVLVNRKRNRYGVGVADFVDLRLGARGVSAVSVEELPDLLRHSTLGQVGISRHQLAVLARAGVYEQIAPGSFIRTGAVDDTTAAWMSIAARRPDATLCLLSALAIHDLTDEIPDASDVALPRGAHRLVVRHASIAWHFFDQKSFGIGRGEHRLSDDLSIGLYSPERTLVDVFRLRHIWGTDLATGALKQWLLRPGSSPGLLMEMARRFPAARSALQATLEVLQ